MTVSVYFSKNNNDLNGRPFAPEAINGRAMVNPHYPVALLPGTLSIIDSGAFQERDMRNRLQPWTALDRQLRLEQQIAWGMRYPDWHAEAIVTYDMLCGVDEALIDGKRIKQRGTEATAAPAVAETLRSAVYYATQRHRIRGAITFAAQGATLDQYLSCVGELLTLMRPGDWFAFGGFCIIGMRPVLKPLFLETLDRTLPLLRRAGIARAHVLGVAVADMVRAMADASRRHDVALSTDSSSIEINSAVFGKRFADGHWTRHYVKAQKHVDYHPATWALENIQRYYDWSCTL